MPEVLRKISCAAGSAPVETTGSLLAFLDVGQYLLGGSVRELQLLLFF
jgi:hypothetical protein